MHSWDLQASYVAVVHLYLAVFLDFVTIAMDFLMLDTDIKVNYNNLASLKDSVYKVPWVQ